MRDPQPCYPGSTKTSWTSGPKSPSRRAPRCSRAARPLGLGRVSTGPWIYGAHTITEGLLRVFRAYLLDEDELSAELIHLARVHDFAHLALNLIQDGLSDLRPDASPGDHVEIGHLAGGALAVALGSRSSEIRERAVYLSDRVG